jgi:hypothetical protein
LVVGFVLLKGNLFKASGLGFQNFEDSLDALNHGYLGAGVALSLRDLSGGWVVGDCIGGGQGDAGNEHSNACKSSNCAKDSLVHSHLQKLKPNPNIQVLPESWLIVAQHA